MKSFKTKVYFHREKEDNWDIIDKASELKFQNTENLGYLGYEIDMDIEVFEDGTNKVLKINEIDVEDKNITI